ncbi:hypothetical protein [Kytococcus sedentarius]|uniref:hypothetical protein n=1 Tax=Kytococcus sedentarius TaxID=1276 RepID=UPI003850A8A5
MSRHADRTRAFAAVSSAEFATLAAGDPVTPEAGWQLAGEPGVEPSEEASEEAMEAAADAAVARSWPVLVLAADLEGSSGPQPTQEVRLRDVAAFHLGDDVVSSGRLEAGPPWELSWYDAAEVDEVRRLLG